MDGRLREAKAERRETDKDRKSAEAVAHLKRAIPGATMSCALGTAALTWQHAEQLPACASRAGRIRTACLQYGIDHNVITGNLSVY